MGLYLLLENERSFPGYMYRAQEIFFVFSQMSSFSTTLSLQNELLNSHEHTAISSFDIYPNNLMSIHIDSLVHTIYAYQFNAVFSKLTL